MNQNQIRLPLYANRSLFTSVSASVSLLLLECLPPLVPESGTFHSCSYTTSRGGTRASRGAGELSATGRGQLEVAIHLRFF